MQQGFGRVITGSLVAHLALIAAGVLLYDAGVKKGYRLPPYSVVSIVEGPVVAPRPVPAGEAGVKAGVPARPAPEVEKKKAVKVKSREKAGKARDAAVSEAIKKIALKVRKKERKAVVDEGIASLRKKREGTAGRAAPSRGIDDIRREIEGRASARNSGASAGRQTAASGTGTGIGAAGAASQEGFMTRYPAYYSLIRDRVQSKWIYPEEWKESKILVTVLIRIGKNGNLMETRVEAQSGNVLFDESLISAVKKSAPFPPLPHGFEADYLEAVLRFCSSC